MHNVSWHKIRRNNDSGALQTSYRSASNSSWVVSIRYIISISLFIIPTDASCNSYRSILLVGIAREVSLHKVSLNCHSCFRASWLPVRLLGTQMSQWASLRRRRTPPSARVSFIFNAAFSALSHKTSDHKNKAWIKSSDSNHQKRAAIRAFPGVRHPVVRCRLARHPSRFCGTDGVQIGFQPQKACFLPTGPVIGCCQISPDLGISCVTTSLDGLAQAAA